MRESLRVIAGLLAEEAQAAAFMSRTQSPLNDDESLLVARCYSAGIAQLAELNRELLLVAMEEEQRAAEVDAGVEI